MNLNSRYTGIWRVVAATALACGSEGSAVEAGAGNGSAGSTSAASSGASAGATYGSGQATGGTGSGTNSEGQPDVSGGVDGDNGSNAGNSGGSAGSPAMLGNGGSPLTPPCTASACPAVDVNADGAPDPACCTMAGACGGEIENMGTTFCAPAGGAPPFEPEPIVPDSRCLEQTLNNQGTPITLPGCCDSSGVCGVSTAPVAGDAGAGVPIACLTPADLAGFGVAGDAGTFAEVSCQ